MRYLDPELLERMCNRDLWVRQTFFDFITMRVTPEWQYQLDRSGMWGGWLEDVDTGTLWVDFHHEIVNEDIAAADIRPVMKEPEVNWQERVGEDEEMQLAFFDCHHRGLLNSGMLTVMLTLVVVEPLVKSPAYKPFMMGMFEEMEHAVFDIGRIPPSPRSQ